MMLVLGIEKCYVWIFSGFFGDLMYFVEISFVLIVKYD